MLNNALKEITLNICNKEVPICCDDWDKLKYTYFLTAIASMQGKNEDNLFKFALYLDYVDNNVWDALDVRKNKIILKMEMYSKEEFIDEVFKIDALIHPDSVKNYLDYEEVWDDMQAGMGEFSEWTYYPVVTTWGFIALIPR